MKIEDFSKYRKLIESDGFIPNEEAEKVYRWMEDTGRLDESFFGAVWKWLKRNFSIKARKIHSLADEYEKELIEETRAEYNAMKSKQDLAAKFRKAWTGRLSQDIKERMEIIASDDEEYRDLVRTLVNKKNLYVRKMMIKEFTGQLDPDEVRSITSELNNEYDKADAEYKKRIKEMTREDAPKVMAISTFIQKKMTANSSMFKQIEMTSRDEQTNFVSLMIAYVKELSKKSEKIELDKEVVWEMIKKYVHLVTDIADKIDGDLSREEKFEVTKKSLNDLMDDFKNVRPIEDYRSAMSSEVKKNIEKSKSKGGTVKPEDLPEIIVTDDSDKVSDIDVDDAVKTAVDATKEETGKNKPTTKEVSKEIIDSVSNYFNNNADDILSFLKKEVAEFNDKSDDEKKKLIGKFDYELDDKNKLSEPTIEDLKLLLEDFVKIAGKIVPYYEYGEKSARYASIAVAEKIFQVYAIKKDLDKKLSEENINDIVNAIKD